VKLAAFCGGHFSALPSAQLSHELGLSSVFAAKRLADSGFEWTLITQSGPRGGRVDAVSSDGTLIELIGRYSGAKVGGKLALSAAIGATLELW
jgi:monoamine oxidase